MPKLISNQPWPNATNLDNFANENKFPSLICNLTAAGKIIPNQLYCCSNGDCNFIDESSTNCFDSNIISQCFSIAKLGACQRTDVNTSRVCEWKGDYYFCLSEVSTNSFRKDFFEAIKWMVSRNTVEESYNGAMACGNEAGFHSCNGKEVANETLTCGDLFSKEYVCLWKSDLESIPRQPLGEVCEVFPTQTVVTTITNSSINTPLFIGLTSVTGVLGIYFLTTLIVGGLCFYRRLFSPIRV